MISAILFIWFSTQKKTWDTTSSIFWENGGLCDITAEAVICRCRILYIPQDVIIRRFKSSSVKGFSAPISTCMLISMAVIFPVSSNAVLYEASAEAVCSIICVCSSCEKHSFTGFPVLSEAMPAAAQIIALRQSPFVEYSCDFVFVMAIFSLLRLRTAAAVLRRLLIHVVGV